MANYIPKSSLDQPIGEKDKVREKPQPVVTGQTSEKKKTLGTRIKNEFVSEDGQNILDWFIFDFGIPRFKEGLISLGQDLLDMFFNRLNLYARPNYRSGSYNRSYIRDSVSYRPYVERRDSYYNYNNKPMLAGGYDYNEILYDSIRDAENVLFGMDDIIQQYQVVSVAEYLELSKRTPNPVDYKYGWTSVQGVRVIKDRRSGQFYLDLPRPMALD